MKAQRRSALPGLPVARLVGDPRRDRDQAAEPRLTVETVSTRFVGHSLGHFVWERQEDVLSVLASLPHVVEPTIALSLGRPNFERKPSEFDGRSEPRQVSALMRRSVGAGVLPNPLPSWLSGTLRAVGRNPNIRLCVGGTGEWRGPESNWRHHDFQSCALPTELPRRERAQASGRPVSAHGLGLSTTSGSPPSAAS
jgi:hypothetical protein